jgi:AcrR family transcriptional regulator
MGISRSRLSRDESQAQTRARLLEAARLLFGRDGYAATSVGRIAEHAGYSKGAAYANFQSKEDLFLAVLQRQGQERLDALIEGIARAADADEVIRLLSAWAEDRSQSGGWTLTILEYARQAGRDATALRLPAQVIRGHWQQLGTALHRRFPALAAKADPLTLGALLHEIAYAPVITLIGSPSSGDLMRAALTGLIGERQERPVRRAGAAA